MELAPKTAVQIFFIVLVGVAFISFGKTYINDTITNTTNASNTMWADVNGTAGE